MTQKLSFKLLSGQTVVSQIPRATTARFTSMPSYALRIVIVLNQATDLINEFKSMDCPYTFRTDDEVPEKLADVVQAGMFAWDTKGRKRVVEKDPGEVEVTGVTYMRPIKNRKVSKSFKDKVGEVASEFEKTTGL